MAAPTVDEILDEVEEETLGWLRTMPRVRPGYIPAPHAQRLEDVGCICGVYRRGWHAYRITELGEEVQDAMP